MIVTRTGWDGPLLRIGTSDGDLPLDLHGPFHWRIGPGTPPIPPRYVFEPRSLDAIAADLAAAPAADRPALEAEQALCDRPHVVYAAFYGILPKVGMTGADRFETRLREQGADAGFRIATTADRAGARRIEQEVSFLHRLPQHRTHRETFGALTRPLDLDRVRERAEDLRHRLRRHHDPEDGLFVVPDVPLGVLPSRPHKVPVGGEHQGRFLGAKGPYLFFHPATTPERLGVGGHPVLALRHTELPGRGLEILD